MSKNPLRTLWRQYLAAYRYSRSYCRLHLSLRKNRGPLTVIVGASATSMTGWISTEYPCVDIAKRANISKWFNDASVSAFLAEHVWEHLTPDQASAAADNVFHTLKPGGYIRIAVPDGNHPDPLYIDAVKPGGSGEGAEDHKVLYTVESLTQLFESAGFVVEPLEWFDKGGQFHETEWAASDGIVTRSRQNDPRNTENPYSFTSLIIDASKPTP